MRLRVRESYCQTSVLSESCQTGFSSHGGVADPYRLSSGPLPAKEGFVIAFVSASFGRPHEVETVGLAYHKGQSGPVARALELAKQRR